MQVIENYSLKLLNTFGIDVKAKFFAEISNQSDLEALFAQKVFLGKHLLLGGGSNILFVQDFDAYVLKISSKGIEVLKEDSEVVVIKAQAGEDWDSFVEFCVNKGYGGIENLSLIPGNVGSCPIQNIGAYGVEVKDVIESVEVYEKSTLERRVLSNSQCCFGYRNSIFKNESKDKYIITSVTFRLSKNSKVNIEYGAIKQELSSLGMSYPEIKDVRQAVCNIRNAKLPDYKLLGNAGSFFKNPVISSSQYHSLIKNFPKLVSYKLDDDLVKVAAGWLIEQAGWKGYREGDAGVHEKQALVLVNYGNASGKDILNLSKEIIDSIASKFGVLLEREVNII